MKNAAIYDPYLDTLGGGERYCLTLAEFLADNHFLVDILFQPHSQLLGLASNRFSLNLNRPEIRIKSPLPLHNIVSRYQLLSKYDFCFYISDGSIPSLFSAKNILHFQVPFIASNNSFKKILNSLKLKLISAVVCNSNFTAGVIQRQYHYRPTVIYPPVDINKFKYQPDLKEKMILAVGRFDNVLNAKRQDVLIEAFSQFYAKNPKWRLVLAGGSLEKEKNNSYLNQLKNHSKNLPVTYFVNPSFDSIKDLYQRSTLFWHAAGYQINQLLEPHKTEHFGMSTVEAMASGSIPLVYGAGGLPEIINHQKNGYLWKTVEELLLYSNKSVIRSKQNLKIINQALKDCQHFSKNRFNRQFSHLL